MVTMKSAKVKTICTKRDLRGTHNDYTVILRAGRKGTGRELGRVHVWGDSPKSEEKAIDIIAEMGKGYNLIW